MNRDFNFESIRQELFVPEEKSRHLVIGVYGRPGSGKTTFGASAGKVGTDGRPNTLVIDTEKSYLSLRGAPGVVCFSVKQWDDTKRIWHLLQSSPDLGGFAGGIIVIDTLSSLMRLALAYVAGDYKIDMTNLTTDASGSLSPREYGDAGRKMEEVIDKFTLLSDRATIVFNCHQRKPNDGFEGNAELVPDLTPTVAKAFQRVVDLEGYMEAEVQANLLGGVDGGEFVNRIHFEPSLTFESKDRISGAWVDVGSRLAEKTIRNPKLADILKQYRQGGKKRVAAPLA